MEFLNIKNKVEIKNILNKALWRKITSKEFYDIDFIMVQANVKKIIKLFNYNKINSQNLLCLGSKLFEFHCNSH